MIESKKFKNPFPGLRPFETDEYRLFFGREGQSDALITRLQRSRLLAVVGTSGSGKSSLVRAGLLPALRGGMMAGAGAGWRIAIMRPGSDPFSNLASALADKDVLPGAGGGLPPLEAKAVIEATLRRGSLGLVDAVSQGRLAEHEKLLIVVDQFEELFRFRAARASTSTGDDASAFVKLLLEAANQRQHSIYIVLTMRSDFLGDCAQFQGLPEAINDGQYLIPRMTRDERRIAITGPIGVARGRIAEPLVSRLLNDVGDNPDQLPILQHALMRTWDYWTAHRRNSEPLGLEHYQAIGTMDRALSVHADEAYEILDDRSKRIAELLFKCLSERGADNREIRRPTRISEICDITGNRFEEVSAVIEVFRYEGCSFLMPPEGVPLTPDTVIDISHESLIRNWRRLQKWVDEEAISSRIYRRLAEAAALHREGSEGLLKNPALQIALDWREQHKPNAAWARRYNPEFAEAMEFLDASKAAHEVEIAAQERQREEQLARDRRELEMTRDFAEKQTRAARRMRWLAAGMAVMFFLSMVTAGYALALRNRAEKSAQDAIEAQTRAEKSALEATEARATAENSAIELAATNLRLTDEKKKTDIALKAEQRAVESQKAALQAQKLATERANEQTIIAKKNLESFNISLERSTATVLGAASFQREDYLPALDSFDKALKTLDDEQKRPNNDENTKSQLTFSRAALLSNLGATQLKLGESDQTKLREAVKSYEDARAILAELERRAGGRLTADVEWTLFDVLYGGAYSYRNLATSLREKFNYDRRSRSRAGNVDESNAKSVLSAEVKDNLIKAEEYFNQALATQEKLGTDSARLARDYEELGRAYLDNGKLRAAEEKFEHAIKLRHSKKALSNERAALTSAQKQLAEVYQLEGRPDDAVRVLKEMVILLEDIPVNELAEQGQEIANGYSDLGQLYSAMGETKQANNAYQTANLLQRAAMKLRRVEKYQGDHTGAEWLSLVKDLTADLDELGDAYAALVKFPDAAVIYEFALAYRSGSDEVWKSYDKLTKFYRDDVKDATKAEDYNNRLLQLYKDGKNINQYVNAMVQLAALYAKDPNRFADAESLYTRALTVHAEQDDWQYPNLILYSLGEIYRKQKKLTEREQAVRSRLELLTKYFDRLLTPGGPQPKSPITLITEYLNAVEASAYILEQQKRIDEAQVAYQHAFEAYDQITSTIYTSRVLTAYASNLAKYQKLLNKFNKQAEAARVAEKSVALQEKFDEIRKQEPEQTQRSPSQSVPTTP